jgi:hypothetical protein
MSDVKITTRLNGPILVTGPFTLVDHEGNAFNLAGKESVAICRCGASGNKPFWTAPINPAGPADQKAPTA